MAEILEALPVTLANICLDVQISICMFLHPSDILALRKTCKALQPSTRQRTIWVAALLQVCVDNALFLPSFPISDMSDLEIEKAAMGPRRWIELCAAFEKKHLNDPGAIMCPRATRIIDSSFTTEIDYDAEIFIVPGGRYLVGSSPYRISVLDLGYTSSADCKLIASVQPEGPGGSDMCIVQATSDGMGLTIFSSNEVPNCSVYEIYPQSETPHLTQIAYLDVNFFLSVNHYLLPDTVFWFVGRGNKIVFWVWNYRLNHSISFSVDVDLDVYREFEVIATKTAIIVLRVEAILIWAIPPLSPHPPDFFDHNPTQMPPPLFTIAIPDHNGIALHSKFIGWNTMSSWYFDSPSLYFDMLCRDSKLLRFQIMLQPDLSTASLHVINTSELTPHDFRYVFFENYRICEDTLVSCWYYYDDEAYEKGLSGVYTGITSARLADLISYGGPAAKMLLPNIGHEYRLFSCPVSGRFVRLDFSNRVAVLDFF